MTWTGQPIREKPDGFICLEFEWPADTQLLLLFGAQTQGSRSSLFARRFGGQQVVEIRELERRQMEKDRQRINKRSNGYFMSHLTIRDVEPRTRPLKLKPNSDRLN